MSHGYIERKNEWRDQAEATQHRLTMGEETIKPTTNDARQAVDHTHFVPMGMFISSEGHLTNAVADGRGLPPDTLRMMDGVLLLCCGAVKRLNCLGVCRDVMRVSV